MQPRIMAAILLLLSLSACTLQAGTPPALTSLPAIPESDPGQTDLQPNSESTKAIGTPVPGWEEIPIMPGAYDAELEDLVYLYSVNAPIDQVEEFYLGKMDVNGWTLTGRLAMEAGSTGGPSTVLDFQRDEQFLNIMLVPVANQNATAVILSALGP